MTFVELKGDSNLEQQSDNDERLRDLRTYAKIGEWLASVTKSEDGEPDDIWIRFYMHMRNFNYSDWQKGSEIVVSE